MSFPYIEMPLRNAVLQMKKTSKSEDKKMTHTIVLKRKLICTEPFTQEAESQVQ